MHGITTTLFVNGLAVDSCVDYPLDDGSILRIGLAGARVYPAPERSTTSDHYRESLKQLGVDPGHYAASLDRLDVLDTLAEEGDESAIAEFEQLCDQLARLCKDLDRDDWQYGVGGS